MTLLGKFTWYLTIVSVVAGALIIGLSRRAVHRAVVAQAGAAGAALAADLARQMTPGARAGSERLLLPLVQRVRERCGAAYALVLAPDGRILAHTNVAEVGRVVADAVSRAALARQDAGWAETRMDQLALLDLSLPVGEEDAEFLLAAGRPAGRGRVGVLRIGLPLTDAIATERRITWRIVWIVLAAAVAVLVAGFLLVRHLLAPIGHLAAGTERIARGEFDTAVPGASADELGRLAGHFNRMAASLKRAGEERAVIEGRLHQVARLEALGLMAATVAHNFNNVLGVFRTNADWVRRRVPGDAELAATVQDMGLAVDQGVGMTQALKAFASGQMLELRILELDARLAEHAGLLRKVASDRAEVVIVPGAPGVCVRADVVRLGQVLLNLVSNARDAVPAASGRIEIATRVFGPGEARTREHPAGRPGPTAVLSVRDNGTGMDAATMERMFEPFFTTKPKGQGTGLGLASVYGIVNQFDGEIWAESALGRGTTFHIALPAVAERPDAPPPPRPPAAPARGETILLVDDTLTLRHSVRVVLADAGYRVIEAGHAAEALAVAAAHAGTIDLLLTDVIMPPGEDGFALARRFAAARPATRVLVMSAFVSDPRAHAGGDGPVPPFIEKPFTESDLLHKVREALDGR